MSAAGIIGALLAASNELTQAVPAERMKAGLLPDGIVLPALLVRVISVVDRQPLRRGGVTRSTARIAVTVRAANYRQQGEIMRLSRAACAGFVGDIAGTRRASVLTAGLGPDVIGPGNSFEQTQDFRVSFDAAD